MERTTYMQKKRKGGFTLAEFLVVIQQVRFQSCKG